MYDAISQCLSHHKFNVLCWDVQLWGNIFEVNVGIGEWYSSQTYSYHNLVQSQDYNVQSIFLESLSVLFNHVVEIYKLPLEDHLDQPEVREQVGEDEFIWEDFTVGDFSQKQFNNNSHFLALNFESFSDIRWFSQSLVEHFQSLSILPPNSFDSSSIVQILTKLIVGFAFREWTLFYQIEGGLKMIVFYVVAKNEVEDGALTDLIWSHACSIQSLKKILSNRLVSIVFFMYPSIVVIESSCIVI